MPTSYDITMPYKRPWKLVDDGFCTYYVQIGTGRKKYKLEDGDNVIDEVYTVDDFTRENVT